MEQPFRYRFRVRYGEVDLQGVVFNARYLDYADLVITEYWRERGLHCTGAGALEFHVRRAEIDFLRPIRADQWIEGRAATRKIGETSITTAIDLYPMTADGSRVEDEPCAAITLVHVHVDLQSGRPARLPDAVRALWGVGQGSEDG